MGYDKNYGSATTVLYHATNWRSANSILQGGFCRGSGGLAGSAIYFASSQKKARNKSQRGSDTVLRVEVALGCCYVLSEAEFEEGYRKWWWSRANSVYIPCRDVYAIRDKGRVKSVKLA
jgi:hypothetical protein